MGATKPVSKSTKVVLIQNIHKNPRSTSFSLYHYRAISTYDSPSPRYENLCSLPLNHISSDRPYNDNKNGDTLLDKESTLA